MSEANSMDCRVGRPEPEWVVVPVAPTTAMLVAGNHCQPGQYSAALVWKAMVEAAQRSGELSYTRPPLQDMMPPNTN